MYGKILIECELTLRSGLHIGASGGFSAIGAVDSPVIRDPMTDYPIVPGSSLKGKLRSLLVKKLLGNKYRDAKPGKNGKPDTRDPWNNDPEEVKYLFGSSRPIRPARLQFADCPVINPSDLRPSEMTEVKTENSVNRYNGIANPRQIERVNSGISFAVRIVYEAYNGFESKETQDDLQLLATAMRLLQRDYLGGHGSRGSGRISFLKFRLSPFPENVDIAALEKIFAPVEADDPFAPDDGKAKEGGTE